MRHGVAAAALRPSRLIETSSATLPYRVLWIDSNDAISRHESTRNRDKMRLHRCSSKRTCHHEEGNPRKRRCVVQKVGHDRGDQTAPPQEIGYAPHHAEKCSGYGDPEPGEEALVQVTCVREAERNAGDKDLRYLPVTGVCEFCHEEGPK